MAKARKQKEQEHICPIVDKYQISAKLKSLVEESSDIAEYIDDTVHYGRALGYAEGKSAAYAEILNSIIEGDFDPLIEEEGCYGYEM